MIFHWPQVGFLCVETAAVCYALATMVIKNDGLAYFSILGLCGALGFLAYIGGFFGGCNG